MTNYEYKSIASPVGTLRLVASDRGLTAILWPGDPPQRVRLPTLIKNDANPILCRAEQQLGEYFLRKRRRFEVPLDFEGTEFQKSVWQALLTIPYGETRSYLQIATQVKRPKAARAVGAAVGRNPISIIAACHRVIGASGALTGFAGGLPIKSQLLELETTSAPD